MDSFEQALERNGIDEAMKNAALDQVQVKRGAKQLMLQAAEEIAGLRRDNEIMRAKLEMVDLFALTLNTRPAYPPMGSREDVAQALRSYTEVM